jgi:hypothetical protein
MSLLMPAKTVSVLKRRYSNEGPHSHLKEIERKRRYEQKRKSDSSIQQLRREQKRHRAEVARKVRNPRHIESVLGMGVPLQVSVVPKKYQEAIGGISPQDIPGRCHNSFGVKVWNSNIDDLLKAMECVHGLKEEICMGADLFLRPPMVVLAKRQEPCVMIIHYSQLKATENPLLDKSTLFGMWMSRPRKTVSSEFLGDLLDLRSASGHGIQDCLKPLKGGLDAKAINRGQTVLQQGTMITAKHVNAKAYMTDGDGRSLKHDEFFLCRSAMGVEGERTDRLCKEFITPGCALADLVFRSWPKKLKRLHKCVSDAFDGSTRLSYTNMLVTVGNKDGKDSVTHVLNMKGEVVRKYFHPKAGTMLHNDKDNAKGTPCVAIFLGAYDGFDYYFPTMGIKMEALSGSVLVGDMEAFLHGVGGGTGVRITLVYCQHKQVVDGVLKTRRGEPDRVLVGAKRSQSDVKRERKAEGKGKRVKTAVIEGLSKYDFA